MPQYLLFEPIDTKQNNIDPPFLQKALVTLTYKTVTLGNQKPKLTLTNLLHQYISFLLIFLILDWLLRPIKA